jgi:hypothetical protein
VATTRPSGTVDLDYPYVVTTTQPERARAARAFGQLVADVATRAEARSLGFAGPAAAPAATRIADIQQMWERTVLGARMLILMQASAPMSARLPGTAVTRMAATEQVASQGIRLFSANSQVGLWEYASGLDGSLPYRQVAPWRTLSAGQRSTLLNAFASTRPVPRSTSGLYDSVLAAYRQAVATYQPNHNNVLAVLTDGLDNDPRSTLTARRFLTELRAAANPMRPVAIVPIGFGPEVDGTVLRQMAQVTGGQAFVTRDPADIQQVFLAMLIRLTCGAACPIS